MGGLKKTVFDKLVQSMITLQQSVEEQKPKQKATKRGNTFIDAIEAKAKGKVPLSNINNPHSYCILFFQSSKSKKMLRMLSQK